MSAVCAAGLAVTTGVDRVEDALVAGVKVGAARVRWGVVATVGGGDCFSTPFSSPVLSTVVSLDVVGGETGNEMMGLEIGGLIGGLRRPCR